MTRGSSAFGIVLSVSLLWGAGLRADDSPESMSGVLCETVAAVEDWNAYLIDRRDESIDAALQEFNANGRSKKCHEFNGIVVSLSRVGSFVRQDSAVVVIIEIKLLSLPTSRFFTYAVIQDAGAAL